jgi:tetratricopeptide (TPR) repeat protein
MGLEFQAGAEQRRRELADQAVTVARRVGEPATLARALMAREHIFWQDDHPPGLRVKAGEEISALAEASRDPEMTLEGQMWRMIGFLESGDIGGFILALDTYEQLARQLGQPLYLFYALSRRTTAALVTGRFEEAERLIEEAEAVGRRVQNAEVSIVLTIQRLCLAVERGQREVVAANLPWFREFQRNFPVDFAPPAAFGAWFALSCHRQEEAHALLKGVVTSRLGLHGWSVDRVLALALLSEVGATTTEQAVMTELRSLLLPYGDRVVLAGGALWCAGAVARYLGLLSSALGAYDEAEAHFEDAMSLNRRLGARPWLARTNLDWARSLLARGAPDDARRAAEKSPVCLACRTSQPRLRRCRPERATTSASCPWTPSSAARATTGRSPSEARWRGSVI